MQLNQLRYPFAEQASQINGFVLKEKKSIYCWTRLRPTWTFGESDDQVRDKSESKYQRVQDKSETIEKRLESGLESETGLEYYSPTIKSLCINTDSYKSGPISIYFSNQGQGFFICHIINYTGYN